jgi:hypothetical protein
VSGKAITVQQVQLYMESRKEGSTQARAAAKAGVSERSARSDADAAALSGSGARK